jgi:hypothetical protein
MSASSASQPMAEAKLVNRILFAFVNVITRGIRGEKQLFASHLVNFRPMPNIQNLAKAPFHHVIWNQL